MCDSEEEFEGEEEGEDETITNCLFCSQTYTSVQLTLQHCQETHNIDLNQIRIKLKLDFYGWIKFINYIRKMSPSVQFILELSSSQLFDSEEYLLPVITDDPLLQWDTEGEEGEGEGGELSVHEKLLATERQLALTRESLDTALHDLEAMRQVMKEITLINDSRECGEGERRSGHDNDGYFSGYSHYGIHEEMLKDEIRMDSYELFVSKNSKIFKDKVILDIGCGTGILSLFAVKAGASHVYAIDQSDIIEKAKEIAKENGVSSSVITFIKGQVETIQLPVDKVDVIISEWMGYFLLFESMLDTVLYARDKWLKDKRNVYPNKCSMSLVAMGDGYEYNSKVNFWDDVRGFRMSCMKEEVLNEPSVRLIDEYTLISTSDVIKKFDLSRISVKELDFETTFTLTIKQNDTCYGLVGYFDISFDVPDDSVYFSTGPMDTPTHWQQTVFFLKEPVKVITGDMLRGTIKCSKNISNSRSLDVYIKMNHLPLTPTDTSQLIMDHTYCLS